VKPALSRLRFPHLGFPRLKWFVLLRGVMAILFGLVVFLWPNLTLTSLTLKVLALLFGTFAALDGILNILGSFGDRRVYESWWVYFAEGLISLIVGLVTFFVPAVTGFVLLYLIVVWAITQGLFELGSAIWMRAVVKDARLVAAKSIITLLFGVVLLVRPGNETNALAWAGVIAYYALTLGVMEVAGAISHREAVQTVATA
jgi:uncharacterized membrane protein HdeD (DUF308 family)